ncbi:uncharacterized protein LOC110858239 [Folsomia candida]|uniref:Uncharacterized protein n=1 Tax=Folsomia candida TaxID=158441 RepID=A0A226DHQ3_FOLCA|nr:uncharacterized protein LOC110858239 [Folsomia candida]OXA44131.1 hypothetical protein Fcan01_21238 [Folsomia candida]
MEAKVFFGFCVLFVLFFENGSVTGQQQSPLASLAAAALNQYSEYVKLKSLDKSLSEKDDNPETRGGGGYGHGGGGHGHGHYGAITLDPVSIISLLALGAFLINNILQLLRANAPAPAPAPGKRSFSSLIPESIFPVLSAMEMNSERKGDSILTGEPNFGKFFENVGSLYYLQPKKRNLCIKKVVCGYLTVQKSREDTAPGNFKTSVFDFMLSTISRFVVPELTSPTKDDVCKKFNKLCSDSLLQDAKISVKHKVYHEMSNLISALTVGGGVSQMMG